MALKNAADYHYRGKHGIIGRAGKMVRVDENLKLRGKLNRVFVQKAPFQSNEIYLF